MASQYWKVNFFFKGFGQGWSETFYFNSASLDTVKVSATGLAVKRNDCLVDGYRLHAIRITNEDSDRDSLLYDPSLIGILDATPDYPGAALLLRLGVQNLYWRALYFRGVPDEVINITRNSDPTWIPAFNTPYKRWVLQLLGSVTTPGGWRMKVIDKTLSPKIDILDITDLGNDRLSITTVAAHGLAVGDTAIIYNLRGLPTPLGKRQVVVVTNANVYQVRGSLPSGFLYTGTAKSRKFAPLYPVIDRVDVASGTHRNTGRPFGQQRGSRRRRLV